MELRPLEPGRLAPHELPASEPIAPRERAVTAKPFGEDVWTPGAPAPSGARAAATETSSAEPGVFRRGVACLFNMMFGDEWKAYIMRDELPANRGDKGPRWLRAVTTRLDGSKNEALALQLVGRVMVPTPIPGVTLGVQGATKATLRRRSSDNKLELVYERELDPRASVGLRLGVGGGIAFGQWRYQGTVGGMAALDGELVHRIGFVYEIDPHDAKAMQGLAHFFGAHALAETMRVGHQEDPSLLADLRRLAGRRATNAPTKSGTPIPVDASFSRAHLQQLTVFRGLHGDAGLNLSTGMRLGKISGVWGWLKGPMVDVGTFDRGSPQGAAENVVGKLFSLVGGLASVSGGYQDQLEKGVGQILQFEDGKPVAQTMSASTSRLSTTSWGALVASRSYWHGPGDRFAATYDPEGRLIGVDHSVKSTITADHKLDRGETPADPGIQKVLSGSRTGDMAVLTYSLSPEQIAKLRALPPKRQAKEIARAFKDRKDFNLTRTITVHNQMGGIGGIGLNFGPGVAWGSVGFDTNVYHQDAQIVQPGQAPADPLPIGRPW